MSELREEVRAKLVALYEKHRPEQAKFVDTLLKQCPAGREAALLAKVEQKFAQAPEPPAKRPCIDPRQRKNLYEVGDRVMVPLTRGAGGPEETPWVPGEVVEAADPGGTLPSGGRYVVSSDEHCEKPHDRKRLIVLDEAKTSIRPEVCFLIHGVVGTQVGRKLCQCATVMPRPAEPSKGPREGETWRFRIDDRVTCRVDTTGDGTGQLEWAVGTIVMCGGRESGSREGTIAAYKIHLDAIDPYTANPYASWEDISWRRKLGGVRARAVWAARDVHWLVRPFLQQLPGPITGPSIVGLRYAIRPVRGEAVAGTIEQFDKSNMQTAVKTRLTPGDVVPGKWERFDHVTGHSAPAERPKDDVSDFAPSIAAAQPKPVPNPPKYKCNKNANLVGGVEPVEQVGAEREESP